MVPVGWILLACGPEPATIQVNGVVPPPKPPLGISVTPDRSVLALGQTLVLQATVSGDDKPVLAWVKSCESGSLALAVDPLGTLATITAEHAGGCFVWATLDGQFGASAWIRIPPLPIGDACALDSDCAADVPACRVSDVHCGKTCTRTCTADVDRPAAFKCAVSLHVCRAINNPDDVCD